MLAPNLSRLLISEVTVTSNSITEGEVLTAQQLWAHTIVAIGLAYQTAPGKFVQRAIEAANTLYAFDCAEVLFKPTKARDPPFRSGPQAALSYFVGGANVDNGYAEDQGFALNGGRGYDECVFTNHQIVCHGEIAIAMGIYTFSSTRGDVVEKETLEYTFGYTRCSDGTVRIFLHHSSAPYGCQ